MFTGQHCGNVTNRYLYLYERFICYRRTKGKSLFSNPFVYTSLHENGYISFFSLNYIELNLRMLSCVTIRSKINHHRQQKLLLTRG